MEMSYEQYNETLRSIKDPMQQKLFINSYYPLTGNKTFLMYDPIVAEAVNKKAKESLVGSY